jgi:CarD family transcriptional regulator
MKLKVNDYVVHSAHGVGKIKGLASKVLRGEKRIFFRIETDMLTYWLPVVESQSNRIRLVRAPSTFSNAVSVIRKKPKTMDNFFRARIKHIQDEIAKCSVSCNAILIRDMNGRNVNKGLHMNENRILDRLKSQFVNEWSVSAHIEKSVAEIKLETALHSSMAM